MEREDSIYTEVMEPMVMSENEDTLFVSGVEAPLGGMTGSAAWTAGYERGKREGYDEGYNAASDYHRITALAQAVQAGPTGENEYSTVARAKAFRDFLAGK